MASASLSYSANARSTRCTAAHSACPQRRSPHKRPVQAVHSASLARQFGRSRAFVRPQIASQERQRLPACITTAGYPSWFTRTQTPSPSAAAATAAAARAAAVLSTPLWQHAAQSLLLVVASWSVAVIVSRWLVTNADKLEAGEVSLSKVFLTHATVSGHYVT